MLGAHGGAPLHHLFSRLFWFFCGLPPLNLRGGVEGLLSAPVWTRHSVHQAALHCSKNASCQFPALSDTLNGLHHIPCYRSGCAVRRPTLPRVSPSDNKSPKYRGLCCIGGRISSRKTAYCAPSPTRPFPHWSDYASTPVAVVLMSDHFVRIL